MTTVRLRFAPTAYSPAQLREALRIAKLIGRGDLVLLEDPEDAS